MVNLNSKIKRIGFVALVIGFLFLTFSSFFKILIEGRSTYYFVMSILKQDDYAQEYSALGTLGVCLIILGAAFSFAYDKGIGRIVRWISKG